MEKYKSLTWPIAAVIISLAWYIHEIPAYERIVALQVFGEYSFPSQKVNLHLKPNGMYLLVKNHTSYLSGGNFKMYGDTIVLTDYTNNPIMHLLFESEEKLIAIDMDSIPAGEKLLCWLKFYPNGEMKFAGQWKNGQKEGVWSYYDRDGDRTHMTLYDNGKIKEENFQYNILIPGQRSAGQK